MEQETFIENILLKEVISTIEPFLRPEMNKIDRNIAKSNSINQIKKVLNDFCNKNNEDKQKIIEKIKEILNGEDKEKQKCYAIEHQLIFEILDSISNEEKNAERDIEL